MTKKSYFSDPNQLMKTRKAKTKKQVRQNAVTCVGNFSNIPKLCMKGGMKIKRLFLSALYVYLCQRG